MKKKEIKYDVNDGLLEKISYTALIWHKKHETHKKE